MINQELEGTKYITTEGYTATLIEYKGWYKCKVILCDGTILGNIALNRLQKGHIKNPNKKTAFEVGYFGIGEYKSSITNKATKNYLVWKSMMQRCYDSKYQKIQPTYIGCTVKEEWHSFQDFSKWFYENYIEGFQLDKDILFRKNKIYSSETCAFVPQEINSLFTKGEAKRGKYPIGVKKKVNRYQAILSKNGVRFNLGSFKTSEEAFETYKIAKEKYIKELADKWKNQISNEVYQALYNYKVEITD